MKLPLVHLEGEKKQKNMNVLIGKFKKKKTLTSPPQKKTLVKINAIPQTRKTVYIV